MTQQDTTEKNNEVEFGPVLIAEEYAEWFGMIVRGVFYPESGSLHEISHPDVFGAWIKRAHESLSYLTENLDRLELAHTNMLQASETFLAAAVRSGTPPLALFDDFQDSYGRFLDGILRLGRKDMAGTDVVDSETGLRSVAVMERDLQREMARRSRRGAPFCIALLRIDGYTDKRESMENLQAAAQSIRECMRSFDDAYAYWKEGGEFVLCLKQADVIGAQAGVSRIRQRLYEMLEKQSGDKTIPAITLSACISEPMAGDKVMEILENMRKDMDLVAEEPEATLLFKDISPLQRYVDSQTR